MSETETVTLVRCPLCGAVVRPEQIRRVDGDAGDWLPTGVRSSDPRIGEVLARVVREDVTGCALCDGGPVQ